MIWYPCRADQEQANINSTQLYLTFYLPRISRTDLRLGLPLPVGQNVSERSPDVKAVQLER